jgi:hypothetical protein
MDFLEYSDISAEVKGAMVRTLSYILIHLNVTYIAEVRINCRNH